MPNGKVHLRRDTSALGPLQSKHRRIQYPYPVTWCGHRLMKVTHTTNPDKVTCERCFDIWQMRSK